MPTPTTCTITFNDTAVMVAGALSDAYHQAWMRGAYATASTYARLAADAWRAADREDLAETFTIQAGHALRTADALASGGTAA